MFIGCFLFFVFCENGRYLHVCRFNDTLILPEILQLFLTAVSLLFSMPPLSCYPFLTCSQCLFIAITYRVVIFVLFFCYLIPLILLQAAKESAEGKCKFFNLRVNELLLQ